MRQSIDLKGASHEELASRDVDGAVGLLGNADRQHFAELVTVFAGGEPNGIALERNNIVGMMRRVEPARCSAPT